jgi:hypothetical protein
LVNQSDPGKLREGRLLLSALGYGARSIERAYPKVRDALLFYTILNGSELACGKRSLQLLVRRHGCEQSNPSPNSISESLSLVIRLLKTKELESLLDNLDTIPLDAEVVQDSVKERLSDCSSPHTRDLDDIVPTLSVLYQVREQCSQAL